MVGKVLEAGRTPTPTGCSVCLVDIGDGQPSQIVCGAPNVAAGQTVAVATPGAVMPDGTTLRKAQAARAGVQRDDPGRGRARDRARPRRDHRARRRPARGRIAARRRAADLDRRARARDHAEPPRLPGDLRRRPRGPCRHRRAAARAPVERGPGDRRRRRRDRDHRRVPRPVPAVHRSRVRGREDRPEPAVAEGPPDGGRPAADLQRRRHHQLRDAADRAAAARVRPRPRGRRGS